MKTNANLEFLNKVHELAKNMQDLANFWDENKRALDCTKISKDYPFSDSFANLTFGVSNWFLTLLNEYMQNLDK